MRRGVHACRVGDLPLWPNRLLYEVELDGEIVEQPMKLVASRGRLVRRIDAWDDAARDEYVRMCAERAHELARGVSPPLRGLGRGRRALDPRGAGSARVCRGADRRGDLWAWRLSRRARAPDRLAGRPARSRGLTSCRPPTALGGPGACAGRTPTLGTTPPCSSATTSIVRPSSSSWVPAGGEGSLVQSSRPDQIRTPASTCNPASPGVPAVPGRGRSCFAREQERLGARSGLVGRGVEQLWSFPAFGLRARG